MKGYPVAEDSSRSEQLVPRSGSIYDRLDKARAQRMKSLAPQIAANDAANMRPQSPRSKSHLFPTIKAQDAFEPATKPGVPWLVKLGMVILALSLLGGVALLGWGADTRATLPAEAAPSQVKMGNPDADMPAQGTEP